MKNERLHIVLTAVEVALLAVLMALSYQLFVVENGFAPAGLNGIATMIQYKTGFSIGYVSLIINIPLCIFAYFFIEKKFGGYTLLFCLVYALSFLYFQKLGLEQFQYRANGHNTIFPVILSGTISGFIYGNCFRRNASTGGVDVLAKYVSFAKPELNFFWLTFALNVCVAVASFFVYAKPDENGVMVYDYNPVCLCILYCFLSSFMGNTIIRGTKSAVKFTIITEHPAEITQDISRELKHGATLVDAMGSYKMEKKTVILCVVNKHQLVALKNILSRYDETFSFSETVGETYGNFKIVK